MRIVTRLSWLAFISLSVTLLIGWMLPSEFRVERSIKINASADNIYPLIANLRHWQSWGVWFKRDPSIYVEFEGDDSAIGMQSIWSSDFEGSGRMTIIDLIHNEKVVYELYDEDLELTKKGQITLRASEGGTEVVWLDYGNVGSNPVDHYLAAMMDNITGPDVESGLDNLKLVVENR